MWITTSAGPHIQASGLQQTSWSSEELQSQSDASYFTFGPGYSTITGLHVAFQQSAQCIWHKKQFWWHRAGTLADSWDVYLAQTNHIRPFAISKVHHSDCPHAVTLEKLLPTWYNNVHVLALWHFISRRITAARAAMQVSTLTLRLKALSF